MVIPSYGDSIVPIPGLYYSYLAKCEGMSSHSMVNLMEWLQANWKTVLIAAWSLPPPVAEAMIIVPSVTPSKSYPHQELEVDL